MFTEKDNIYWKAFSTSIDGSFIERRYWHSPKVIYTYKDFSIVFDNHCFTSAVSTRSYESFITRIYCKFKHHKPIKIRIEKASFLNRLINLFQGHLLKTKNSIFNKQYQIHAPKMESLAFLRPEIQNKLIDLNIEGLFIDQQEGIWGEPLIGNNFEIAIYVESTRLELSELLALKKLFEHIIDALCDTYAIQSS
ncbi:hypothetical protein HX004_06260 [Myroides sp. 1354]|uniref:hypothetical protein n=1 Tax=unclassified Myroides TaxID=2642485 RepID=UPI0025752664|nr:MULTISPECIES: hypothetical protein [unclassified Myroides]MDM1044664.1 hypothetical protein [Myroides sp. R163-1]MDM1055377.1 hypothetical protein [Myroides sp. 1354]MDM1068674.1 hypothetical protein [Myroides sp. 1372]